MAIQYLHIPNTVDQSSWSGLLRPDYSDGFHTNKPFWPHPQSVGFNHCERTEQSHGYNSLSTSGFDLIRDRSVVSHPSSAFSHAFDGHLVSSLRVLRFISAQEPCIPMHIAFEMLQRCIDEKDISATKLLHLLLVSNGIDSDPFMVCHLIRTYALLDELLESKKVFIKAEKPTVFSWGAIISAHVNLGKAQEALEIYQRMQLARVEPDGYVFVAAIKACTSLKILEEGERIHAQIISCGLNTDDFIGSCLVDMYAKCATFKEANIILQRLPRANTTSWNALIAGSINGGNDQTAMELFQQMEQQKWRCTVADTQHSVLPNAITYIHVLKACSNLASLKEGQLIHSRIIEMGLQVEVSVVNALLNMYAKCGTISDACVAFDTMPIQDVITWSVLMSMYCHEGLCLEALDIFHEMQHEDIVPDQNAFVYALKACSIEADVELGREIHKNITERGFESDLFVGSTLIDMYSKSGALQDARNVFNTLPEKGIVTWNAMLSGYVQYGQGHEALKLFDCMQHEGVAIDQGTYVSVLKACSDLTSIGIGLEVHRDVVNYGLDSDLFISTTLIDFYSSSGSIQDACRIFSRMPEHDVVSWNALISACSQHNEYQLAVSHFKSMCHSGITPNHTTFVCILSACSHAGVVSEGCRHFILMRDSYGILPGREHYDSMVDLFGHAGHLEEAEDLLEALPFAPNITEWTSLLSSCRKHCNVDIGKRCFDCFVILDHTNAAGYALMSNIYAQSGMLHCATEIEELRKYANSWKKPAKAYIEINNHVHEFSVGSKVHPESGNIYAKLESLTSQMYDEGYEPCLDLVLGSELNKEGALCEHSEKLAIAFGLISTPTGTTLRVSKNLRVCADCHSATKIISKIEKREIIIKDAYRNHHFKDGNCSCKDMY